MIRALVVDDSKTAREVIRDILNSDPGIKVVGEARDGQEALDKVSELRPDIVTMDVIMPVKDGLEAVEEIMAYQPTPILVLSSTINDRNVNTAFKAIQLGALDVMAKPGGNAAEGLMEIKKDLIDKVKLLSGIKVISHPRGKRKRREKQLGVKATASGRVVAIGASTGGPQAIMTILKELPTDFSGGMFIVQHIASGFSKGFAQWLAQETRLNVKEAEQGEQVKPGMILVAPSDLHMEIIDEQVQLTDSPPVNSCRPSADKLFASIAQCYESKAIGIILTGMGRDGTKGIKDIKDNGGLTIAQDEQSSVVFGMPKSAISFNVIDRVLPLSEIGKELVKIFR
ncbi:MAG: chemotaxis response regulator protein-glutamate methylesterase [Deltaproteobacteria bacterium]|nr:MAG: chemotaxis response regulator protein-glutamate methylesterase [Deltaproteobacteria bacterium]